VEDLHRYGEAWKRMAEALHPHEWWRRYPRAALAFAVLRRTPLDPATPFGEAMLAAAADQPELLRFDGVRLRWTTFGGKVEGALRERDLAAALRLLARRPGELARRLAHLARLPAMRPGDGSAAADGRADAARAAAALGEAVATAAPRVSPGVLVAALAQMRTRPGGSRLFPVRGGAARAVVAPDVRPPVPAATAAAVSSAVTGEMLRRAAVLGPVEVALLDAALADLAAPTAERSASSALTRLTRGSVQPIPDGERIRLFLHWAEPAGLRVDLDLSVIVFDREWRSLDWCDYTKLRAGRGALVHSGDLTSAPEPLGASEFVDMNLNRLGEYGARYVMPVVFSYNAVPFEELVRGFAGFMADPQDGPFDARAVRQRFDLGGAAKVLVPFIADLHTRTLLWVDLNVGVSGMDHNVLSHRERLGELGAGVVDVFRREGRVTLWEVACWHAAARAGEVLLRRRDGTITRHRRAAGEEPAAFAARLLAAPSAPASPTPPGAEAAGRPDFAAVVDGDVEVREDAEVYALYPGLLDPTRVRLQGPSSLLSSLAPERSPAPVTV